MISHFILEKYNYLSRDSSICIT